jgi:hypothetical protein
VTISLGTAGAIAILRPRAPFPRYILPLGWQKARNVKAFVPKVFGSFTNPV